MIFSSASSRVRPSEQSFIIWSPAIFPIAASWVELGFADGILAREEPMEEQPANALMYSEAQVVNSLMGRIAEKCRIVPKTEHKTKAEDLFSRLDLIKNWR